MADSVKSATLQDVADAAGVSMATVSRVLADRGEFSPATRARVLEAAEAVRYRRTWKKGGRPDSSSTAIELVAGRIGGGWTDRVLLAAWRSAARLGLDLTFTMEPLDVEEDWAERVMRRRSLGVVLGLLQPTAAQVARLRSVRLPVVLLGSLFGSEEALPSVGTTERAGGFAAGQHLISLGLTDFVIVMGRPAYNFGRLRRAGFEAALEEAGMGSRVTTVSTGWDDHGPVAELIPMLQNMVRPVGIFTTNDGMALRCYESAQLAGRKVGRDALIVGFDDEPRAAKASPPLTTLHQPLEAMAARAVELIAEARGDDQALGAIREELPTHLVVRESTVPAQASPSGDAARSAAEA